MGILGAIPLDLDTVIADLFDASSAMAITATAGRSGGNSVRANNSISSCTKNINQNLATLFVACAWAPYGLSSGTGTLLQFMDGSTVQCNLRVLSDGTIQAYRNNTTLLGASSPGAVTAPYQHIEAMLTVSTTVGALQVWVNSVSVLNLTGVNTQQTANATVSAFAFGPPFIGPPFNLQDFCDIVWSTARIGDRRVECVVPTGVGTYAQFTPSAGANWQNVKEIPPNDDTTYNDTLTVGNIDSFAHGALSAAPLTIDAVIVNARARNTTTGAGSVAPFIRSGTTDSPGTAVALNTAYQDFQSVYLTDPATGVAWANAAAVNAAQIGYKKTV